MNHHRINDIELPAQDLDAVKSFYQQALDWTFTAFGPDDRAFKDGELDGGFYRSPRSSSAAQCAALVVLYSRDIKATRQAVMARGGRLVRDTLDFPGGRRFDFADPVGNELAVCSEAPAPA
jgi:predicted enzyme related to lactoylglutathione lyase